MNAVKKGAATLYPVSVKGLDMGPLLSDMGMGIPAAEPKPQIFIMPQTVVDENEYAATTDATGKGATETGTPTATPEVPKWKQAVKKYWWVLPVAGLAVLAWYGFKKGFVKLV